MIDFKIRRELTPSKEKTAKEISKELGLQMVTSRLIALRGIKSPDEAQKFLRPKKEDMHDPFLFDDMQKCVKIIKNAVNNKEKIKIYSDYDADGTTAAAIVYLYLKSAGADISIYTPHRHKEGYGLNAGAVKKIADQGAKVLITADCGITNIEEIKLAKKLGVKVIVTDHHECPEDLPFADAILNPKLPACRYPFRHLSGAGVVLKLIEALGGESGEYIDLAALGTIADIVPLLGENRIIAALGIEKMRNNPCVGIKLLVEAAAIDTKSIDSRTVSFGLAPRINAASRMDDARLAVKLLISDKEDDNTRALAVKLCEHNRARQQIEEEILKEACAGINKINLSDEWAVILEDSGWNTGVIGIAASEICEMLYRPVIVFGAEEGLYTGSARSTDEINIFEALNRFKELFIRFGGHSHAAGLTIKKENLPELKKRLNAYLKSAHAEEDIIKKTPYDLKISLDDIDENLINELECLAPFGQDNPPPLFKICGADIVSHSFVGKAEKDHLRFALKEDLTKLNAICFNHVNRYCYFSKENEYIASLSINGFDKKPQLKIQHMRPKISKETLNAYYRSLKKDFIFSFIGEIKSYGESDAENGLFIEKLGEDLKKSRFGTLVLFNTREGLKKALEIKEVNEALKEGRLSLPCETDAFAPDNMLAGLSRPDDRLLSRYKNIYCFGAFALKDREGILRYFDADMKKAYASRAAEYFTGREKLLDIYVRIMAETTKGRLSQEESMEKISAVLGADLKNIAFACGVFFDLSLIDYINDDKIQFKTGGQKKKNSLDDSLTYRSFAALSGMLK